MNTQLKDAIIEKVQENAHQFNLNNLIVALFEEYIYTSGGEYLIGGEQVANFIKEFINLYI